MICRAVARVTCLMIPCFKPSISGQVTIHLCREKPCQSQKAPNAGEFTSPADTPWLWGVCQLSPAVPKAPAWPAPSSLSFNTELCS